MCRTASVDFISGKQYEELGAMVAANDEMKYDEKFNSTNFSGNIELN